MENPINFQSFLNNNNAQWIVLIHGLFGSLDNLSVVRRALEDEYNVLAIDLPDHGESRWTEGFSFQSYAGLVVNLLDNLKITSATLLGHSLGGKVAMQLALSWPSRVDRLILADIAPVAYAPRHENVLRGLRAVDLSATENRNHASQQMAQHIHEAGVRQFLLKSLNQGDAGWAWRFNLDMLERDYPILSGAIEAQEPFTKPVRFIKGGNSDYLTRDHQTAIAKLFPNGEARIIQGAGHWLHAEKPAIFNRLVLDFLLRS